MSEWICTGGLTTVGIHSVSECESVLILNHPRGTDLLVLKHLTVGTQRAYALQDWCLGWRI
jgi:hypothetical protein